MPRGRNKRRRACVRDGDHRQPRSCGGLRHLRHAASVGRYAGDEHHVTARKLRQPFRGAEARRVEEIDAQLKAVRAKVWFELRDGSGALPCSMWREDFEALGIGALADGVQIVAAGGCDYYPGSRTASPSFSFAVSDVRLAGEGDLLAQLERLRRTLHAEGLFEPRRGFGKAWCDSYGDPDGPLGWATADEQTIPAAWQQFENGIAVVARTDLGGITALRLELLPPPGSSLMTRPGRAPNGNTYVRELRLLAAPADDPSAARPAAFERVGIDFHPFHPADGARVVFSAFGEIRTISFTDGTPYFAVTTGNVAGNHLWWSQGAAIPTPASRGWPPSPKMSGAAAAPCAASNKWPTNSPRRPPVSSI